MAIITMALAVLTQPLEAQVTGMPLHNMSRPWNADTVHVDCKRIRHLKPSDKIQQRILGYCFSHGLNGFRDARKAVYWLRKSANQNYSIAQFQLASRYQTGEGVIRDYIMAYVWYSIAIANGFRETKTHSAINNQRQIWVYIRQNYSNKQRDRAEYLAIKCFKDPIKCPRYSN